MKVLTAEEIYAEMKNYIIDNQTRITDFNDGSVISSILNAVARQMHQIMLKSEEGFRETIQKLPYNIFDFQRKPAQKAKTELVFSRPKDADTSASINIPSGTFVSTSAGLIYETENEGSIEAGKLLSAKIPAKAASAGKDYNVPADVITVLVSAISGISAVKNPHSALGGTDSENAADYHSRFTEWLVGTSGANTAGILARAKQNKSILSAYVDEHFPPVENYNFTLYVDDGTGDVKPELLQSVEKAVKGDTTEANQGAAAAGVNFRVLSAEKRDVTVAYSVQKTNSEIDSDVLKESVTSAIEDYINHSHVGVNVIYSAIIARIQAIDGVKSIKTLTLNSASEDIEDIQPKEVPRVKAFSQENITL